MMPWQPWQRILVEREERGVPELGLGNLGGSGLGWDRKYLIAESIDFGTKSTRYTSALAGFF